MDPTNKQSKQTKKCNRKCIKWINLMQNTSSIFPTTKSNKHSV